MSVTRSQLVPLPIESDNSLKNLASFSLPAPRTCQPPERQIRQAASSLVFPNRLLLLRIVLFVKRVNCLFRLEDRLLALLL